MKSKKKKEGISAASMADVAFLLLFFFMIVTTINQDQGLFVKLPRDDFSVPEPINKRNVLEITLNDYGELMVNGEVQSWSEMKTTAELHITNKGELINYSQSPKHAVILLKQSRGAKYEDYILIHETLKEVYSKVRDDTSLHLTNPGYSYKEIVMRSEEEAFFLDLKRKVQDSIPFLLQEDLSFQGMSN